MNAPSDKDIYVSYKDVSSCYVVLYPRQYGTMKAKSTLKVALAIFGISGKVVVVQS